MILGIEIGGTKLQLGVSSGRDRQLVDLNRFDVCRQQGAEGILQQIGQAAPLLIKQYGVTAIGIGFGGPVDPHRQCVIKSHQVEGWDEYPLGDWCHRQLGIAPNLGNDCNVAALAEARLGAGQGVDRVFYVTVGTGIGGGLVIGGRIDGQQRPAVAEIGHLRPGPQAVDGDDVVESCASGLGVETHTRRMLGELSAPNDASEDLLRRCQQDLSRLTAKTVSEAASDGNAIAKQVLDQAMTTLGWAVAQTITLVAPQRVVVGGGVALIGQPFFLRLQEATERYVFAPLAGSYEIVPAALGELSVVHGAIQLAVAEPSQTPLV